MDSSVWNLYPISKPPSNGCTGCDEMSTWSLMEDADAVYSRTRLQEVYDVLNILFYRVALPIIEVFGIATNCMNLRIFWSIGLKDVGTSSLFALAMADLCYLVVAHFIWLCNILHYLHLQSWVKLDHLASYSLMYVRFAVAVSVLITTYIAVQRCCCVALPLRVKVLFTPTRNLATIVGLCLLAASFYVPWLPQRAMKVQRDPSTNVTWLGLWRGPHHESTREVADYVVSTTFPIATQTISAICMAILINSLRKSSKFRRTMLMTEAAPSATSTTTAVKTEAKEKIKGKEVQVVKAVTFLTLMFIISNTLPIGLGLTRRIVPDFRTYSKQYSELLTLVVAIRDAVQQLNSSLNILVYYHFNMAYRHRFHAYLCRAPGHNTKDSK